MQQQHIFAQKLKNTYKTYLLMGLVFAVVLGLGYALSLRYGSVNFLYGALAVSVLMNVIAYWFSESIAIKSSGAIPADPNSEDGRKLISTVERLANMAHLPIPKIYIIPESNPNAFATGRNAEHASIAATEGLLRTLTQDELDGVIAHELGHIGNKDILLTSVVAALTGIIMMLVRITAFSGGDREGRNGNALLGLLALILAPIAATIIQLAVSRTREFQADATSASITGKPESLARALLKISSHTHTPTVPVSPATAHMYISNPLGGDTDDSNEPGGFARLFMTHPPTKERVERLRAL